MIQAGFTADLSPVAIALIGTGGAIIGGALVSLTTVLTTWLTERSLERRQIRDLAFQSAIEQYKADKAFMLEAHARDPRQSFKQFPLDDYLLGMSVLVRILGKDLSVEELEHELDEKKRKLDVARSRYQSMSEAGRESVLLRKQKGQKPQL